MSLSIPFYWHDQQVMENRPMCEQEPATQDVIWSSFGGLLYTNSIKQFGSKFQRWLRRKLAPEAEQLIETGDNTIQMQT